MKTGPTTLRGLRRDRPATPFSELMEAYLAQHATIEAIVFVDNQGECIDYASRMDPDEAMIMGATWLTPTLSLRSGMARLGAGALLWWVIEAEQRDFVVRLVSDEHLVLIVLPAFGVGARILEVMQPLAEALRAEAGLPAPRWDSPGEAVRVATRESFEWGYAPDAVIDAQGRPLHIEVLGRWRERRRFARGLTCFRVRGGGAELTLAYDSVRDRWYRR